MNSKEALERIKSKYKRCLVQEANRLPFSSDINIENIEEYWHIENKNDFSQIEKDLEVLEILKKWIVVNETNDDLFPYEIKVKNGYVSNKSCLVLIEEDYKKIKEWLDR